ncbi:MAG: NAD-dependent epimerase/dehydratase family protein [Oligoflexia bacterium]|nr:NAD-dependent epimerase/dehydratase family protein [Oligoflexia bacterium]
MRPRIAITGATGFLGRHVVARLVADHDLVCITRGGSAPKGHQGLAVDLAVDLGAANNDPTTQALAQAMTGCAAVIHAAGMVSHAQADAQALWDLHVAGTQRVLAAARQAGVPRVVTLSTSGTVAVSKDRDARDERTVEDGGDSGLLSTISRWPYYRSKWVAEDAALAQSGDGLDIVCLNPGLLLGPGDDADGASTRPIRIFLDDALPVVPEGGPCFVDVRDVADAVVAALTRGQPGRRMLLGGGNMSWRALYGALARITGRTAPLLTAPAALTRVVATQFSRLLGGDDGLIRLPLSPEELELGSYYWFADWSRAETELGFSPRDPLITLEDTTLDILDRRRRGYQLYRSQA